VWQTTNPEGAILQQVVKLTGVEEKAKGTNARGPWVLRVFTAGGGAKFQTFEADLGAAIPLGQTIELTYELEDSKDGKFQNNVIKGWKPSSETVTASEPTSPTSDRDQKQRSKEEVRRTESVKAAATLLVELSKSEDSPVTATLSGLFELADTIAAYVETGQS
jgi:hypothetical protein